MSDTNYKLPGKALTVIIRDDSPIIHCDSGPQFRSVQLTLTDFQLDKLRLYWTGRQGATDHFECISQCFIEPTP